MSEDAHPITADRFSRQCRKSTRRIELVCDGATVAILKECRQIIEEQEQEIAELKLKLEMSNASR